MVERAVSLSFYNSYGYDSKREDLNQEIYRESIDDRC